MRHRRPSDGKANSRIVYGYYHKGCRFFIISSQTSKKNYEEKTVFLKGSLNTSKYAAPNSLFLVFQVMDLLHQCLPMK